MGHYIRILSPSEKIPSITLVQSALADKAPKGHLEVEEGSNDDWTRAILSHESGAVVADIERNTAAAGDMVSEEIEEFLEEIVDCRPKSAADWLTKYLPTVKTIYAFLLLDGREEEQGMDILGVCSTTIQEQVGGIIQADYEGFSDEKGCQILWQFSNSVKGLWWMSVLKDGQWIRFQMDLGKKKHREAFWRGEVPEGVKMLE